MELEASIIRRARLGISLIHPTLEPRVLIEIVVEHVYDTIIDSLGQTMFTTFFDALLDSSVLWFNLAVTVNKPSVQGISRSLYERLRLDPSLLRLIKEELDINFSLNFQVKCSIVHLYSLQLQ